ncbi:NUDIX domain-containing protein [Lentzea aerocolonigenes]|uniref:NUDIX domain-containing protein n=1 Tax=Lentzea aerocolonigenes TaxID=68170 RepID=UPI00069913AE|nr:NUDIX domain-containing protein [Lentzea aerocolonigenes]
MPEQLYREILERMPVVCVDTLVVRAGEALLTRRSQEPQAGSLWLQGGRMRKGEQLAEAALRTAEQESGLSLTLRGVLGTFSTVFEASAHGDSPTHTVNVTFLASAEHDARPRVDSTHDDFVWWPLTKPTGNSYLDQLFVLAAKQPGGVDAVFTQ